MDKKLIKEDIANMKYLFGYKPGRVISEQEQPELEESNPFKLGGGFDDYNFPDKLKDRLSDIYDLLDEVMEDPDNDPSDYSDMIILEIMKMKQYLIFIIVVQVLTMKMMKMNLSLMRI
jgi:hypothetical protein